MKRAKFLEGSGKLSATQLVFILVLFLGSNIDEINGASISNSISLSITPSMSITVSGTSSMSVTYSGTSSMSYTTSGTLTVTQSYSMSTPPTISNSFTPGFTQLLTATASLSTGASPSPTGPPAIPGGDSGVTDRQFNSYFCGNSVKEKQFTEHCDFGALNIPKYTCCTPSCHWANGGRRCAKRFNNCFKIGRCTGYSTCRDSTPKVFGSGCNQNRGFCDGEGNCVPNAKFWFYFFHIKGPKNTLKKKLLKKHLKTRKKYKNFNLADFSRSERRFFEKINASYIYDDDISEGYLQELENIVDEEKYNTEADFDPLDEQ